MTPSEISTHAGIMPAGTTQLIVQVGEKVDPPPQNYETKLQYRYISGRKNKCKFITEMVVPIVFNRQSLILGPFVLWALC